MAPRLVLCPQGNVSSEIASNATQFISSNLKLFQISLEFISHLLLLIEAYYLYANF